MKKTLFLSGILSVSAWAQMSLPKIIGPAYKHHKEQIVIECKVKQGAICQEGQAHLFSDKKLVRSGEQFKFSQQILLDGRDDLSTFTEKLLIQQFPVLDAEKRAKFDEKNRNADLLSYRSVGGAAVAGTGLSLLLTAAAIEQNALAGILLGVVAVPVGTGLGIATEAVTLPFKVVLAPYKIIRETRLNRSLLLYPVKKKGQQIFYRVNKRIFEKMQDVLL